MTEKSNNPNPEEKGEEKDEEPQKPQTPDTPKEGTEEGEQPSKKTEPKGEELPPEPVDYKKKFKDSSRENQRILTESKLKDEKIVGLEAKLESEPPSDKELAEKHPDWEFKEEDEKERIRKNEKRDKDIRFLKEKAAWEDDFKKIVRKPEFTSLKEKEDEFKDFVYDKDPGKKLDIETLAKSFLYKPVEEKEEESKPDRKGLEEPSGGSSQVPPTGMSLKDVERFRKENPKEYLKAVREGRLKEIPEK